MKAVIYMLIGFAFIVVSCQKKDIIPDEYKYLIGKWKCVDCDYPAELIIENQKITLESDFYRSYTEKISWFYDTESYIHYGNKWNRLKFYYKKKKYIDLKTNTAKKDTVSIYLVRSNVPSSLSKANNFVKK